MRAGYKFLTYFFFLLIMLVGCQKKSVDPPMPDVGVPSQEMNKRFSVQAPQAINSSRTKDMVQLVIKLIPNDQQVSLAFHFDFGARIFIEQEDEWVEIKNAATYQNYPGKVILSPSDPWDKASRASAFMPILPDESKVTKVRFILIGNIIKNGEETDEKTAAYIDMTLKP